MSHEPIVVERVFAAPVSKVWTAITDKDEMKHWYFDLTEFKPEVGFTFRFTGGSPDGKSYLHLCEVTEAIPEKKLAYSWRYDGYPGVSFVTFDLSAQGSGTLLKLTHTGLESFPEDNKDFAAANFRQGWDEIINRSLQKYLEQSTV